MAQESTTSDQEKSLHGSVFRPNSESELREAVDLAFDYRGDVTVDLHSGESIVGYVFSRHGSHTPPYLEIFPSERPGHVQVEYADIAAIIFSGKDTADGQSWEAWIQKKREEGKK